MAMSKRIEIRNMQRGGPWQAWGAQLYWRGILVGVWRSWVSRAALSASALKFADIFCGTDKRTPQELAAWSSNFGSMSKRARGQEIYKKEDKL